MMAPSQANIDNPSEKHRQAGRREAVLELKPSGRWPANLIHDGSDEVVGLFPQSKAGTETQPRGKGGIWSPSTGVPAGPQYGDTVSAARFFYCAKASKVDREEGCEAIEHKRGGCLNMRTDSHSKANGMDTGPRANSHPTVKPTALMRYLCRLVTPSGGTVLDPFMGSGSTGKAALLEGFDFIGIEKDAEYFKIAEARITGPAVTIGDMMAGTA